MFVCVRRCAAHTHTHTHAQKTNNNTRLILEKKEGALRLVAPRQHAGARASPSSAAAVGRRPFFLFLFFSKSSARARERLATLSLCSPVYLRVPFLRRRERLEKARASVCAASQDDADDGFLLFSLRSTRSEFAKGAPAPPPTRLFARCARTCACVCVCVGAQQRSSYKTWYGHAHTQLRRRDVLFCEFLVVEVFSLYFSPPYSTQAHGWL